MYSGYSSDAMTKSTVMKSPAGVKLISRNDASRVPVPASALKSASLLTPSVLVPVFVAWFVSSEPSEFVKSST